MLKNYEKDHNGVIRQIERKKFVYDVDYIKHGYDDRHAPVDNMSFLRLGYLLSNLGFVPNNLLDVGYGNGIFLHTAKRIIKNCCGYDIPPAYPLQDIKIVDNIYKEKFDVVCFFDSLEHFEDIYDIKKIQCDYILISLPWCHYLDDLWFESWKHRKPDEHLWHFNLDSLNKFMNEIGYEYVCHSNIEDAIRKPVDNLENILTGIYKKKYV